MDRPWVHWWCISLLSWLGMRLLGLSYDNFLWLAVLRLKLWSRHRLFTSLLELFTFLNRWISLEIIIHRITFEIFCGNHHFLIQWVVILVSSSSLISFLIEAKSLACGCLFSWVSHLHRLHETISIDFLHRRFTLTSGIISIFIGPHHLKFLYHLQCLPHVKRQWFISLL